MLLSKPAHREFNANAGMEGPQGPGMGAAGVSGQTPGEGGRGLGVAWRRSTAGQASAWGRAFWAERSACDVPRTGGRADRLRRVVATHLWLTRMEAEWARVTRKCRGG